MPATYAASAGLARPQSAIARGLDHEHGSLHTAEYLLLPGELPVFHHEYRSSNSGRGLSATAAAPVGAIGSVAG
jgi:hypothetical protein